MFWFRKKTNQKTTQTDWVSVCFGSNREKKFNCFEDPLIENVFWRFFGLFRFVLTKFCLFRLFRYLSETPKQTETNRNKSKKCFLVSLNKPKNNRNRLSFGLFRFEPKKNLIVSRTTYTYVLFVSLLFLTWLRLRWNIFDSPKSYPTFLSQMVVEAGSVFTVRLDDALWATAVEETAFPHFYTRYRYSIFNKYQIARNYVISCKELYYSLQGITTYLQEIKLQDKIS